MKGLTTVTLWRLTQMRAGRMKNLNTLKILHVYNKFAPFSLALAVTQERVTEACAGRIKISKFQVGDVCVTSQTRYARATGAQQTFSARLTHAWGTLLKHYLIISERACSVHWCASNMRRTRSKRIQRAWNALGTYSKRIRHTPA